VWSFEGDGFFNSFNTQRRRRVMSGSKGCGIRQSKSFGGSSDALRRYQDTSDTNGAGIGYERRLVRYRVVSLLDAPDELRSVEIGQLDQGDEVQLLEKSGAYWRVLCPDGRQGWLHKMTLGDVVTDETSSADAWNVGDIDGDVLSAYLAARARA